MDDYMKRVKMALCPIDTVMFRDPKPFEIGGYARSYWNPLPSTFSGLIRSLLREEFPNRKDLYKDHENLKWRVKGPFPSLIKEGEGSIRTEEFYPLPSDVFKENGGGLVTLGPSRHYSYQVKGHDLLSPPRLKNGEVLDRPLGDLMNKKALIAYLENKDILGTWLKKFDDLFGRVVRPGATLDESKIMRFGMFYRVEALEASLRLEGKEMIRGGYLGTILGDDDVIEKLEVAAEKRVARFGGESRPSLILMIHEEEDEKWEKAKKRIANCISRDKRFKVYLATPALFGDCNTSKWIPEWLDAQTLEGQFLGDGLKIKLIGASMGKRIAISGWDYARGCVKPMYFGVPAGSAFYFRIKEGITSEEVRENIIKRLENDNMSDIMSSLGFGTAFVGMW